MQQYPFFTKNDLEDFSKVAGKPYDSTNQIDINYSKAIKNGVWKKTQVWKELLLDKLIKFEGEYSCHWNDRGIKGKSNQIFRPYTWAKIYKKGQKKTYIYFTIGVSGENKKLTIILNYERKGKIFTDQQLDKCIELIDNYDSNFFEIKITDLENYSWEKIVNVTKNFINQNIIYYDKIIEVIWNIKEKRIARLTWNENGWIMPSGKYGKSQFEDSHEAKYGYGHEEWLFDLDKVIDGYHYGFLEPIRKEQETFENNSYDVWLYTINSETKKRYWVGEISNLEVINTLKAEEIKNFYQNNNWLNEMESQIKNSGANSDGFSNWKGIDIFNVRFKSRDVIFNDPYFELSKDHPIYKQRRYAFIFFKNNFVVNNSNNLGFIFIPKNDEDVVGNDDLKTKTYKRKPISYELIYLHKLISNKLAKILKQKYGFNNVSSEHIAGYGSNKIDIVVKDHNNIIFYEIKTYNSLRTSIREALGQIIEYCFWTNEERAKKLIIISQHSSDINDAKNYIKHLRKLTGLNIFLQTFDLEQNQLSDEY